MKISPALRFLRASPVACALATGLLAFGCQNEKTSASGGLTRIENLIYGRGGSRDLKLDLYLPTAGSTAAQTQRMPTQSGATHESASRARPIVVFFHGGGWRVGNKSAVAGIVGPLTDAGFAVASVDFRQSGEALFPAQIFDCKTAIRWIRANSVRYGIDPRRIGVLGFSSGGHLVALLGTTDGAKQLEDLSEGSAGSSAAVQAVCDVSGPIDLSLPTNSVIGKLSVRGLFGDSAKDLPAMVREADPSLYVKGNEPPFLIIQGDQDGLVLPAHAKRLEAALAKAGDDVTLDMVPGAGHVPQGPAQKAEIVRFFTAKLRPQ